MSTWAIEYLEEQINNQMEIIEENLKQCKLALKIGNKEVINQTQGILNRSTEHLHKLQNAYFEEMDK